MREPGSGSRLAKTKSTKVPRFETTSGAVSAAALSLSSASTLLRRRENIWGVSTRCSVIRNPSRSRTKECWITCTQKMVLLRRDMKGKEGDGIVLPGSRLVGFARRPPLCRDVPTGGQNVSPATTEAVDFLFDMGIQRERDGHLLCVVRRERIQHPVH